MNFVRTEPGADPIVVEGHIGAPPKRVFEAWTYPDRVKEWFGSRPGSLAAASIDLRPGGRWRFTESDDGRSSSGFEGEYLEIVRYELLAFTWVKVTVDQVGKRHQTPVSKVEIRFLPAGQGTDLRITHSGLDTDSRIGFRYGWEAGTANLARLLETS